MSAITIIALTLYFSNTLIVSSIPYILTAVSLVLLYNVEAKSTYCGNGN